MPALGSEQKATLLRYAAGTWSSLAALTDPGSGLPADKLYRDGTTDIETSISNIGAYLWSVLVAARLGLLSRKEAISRLEATLGSVADLERHRETGQFYNWYDHRTGVKIAGNPVISSVDNAWLATALHLVAQSVPEVAGKAAALFESMNFACYYQSSLRQIAVAYLPGDPTLMRHYDTIVSESRMATYLGIATGQLPREAYFGPRRVFPEDYERIRPEGKGKPLGFSQNHLGVEVFEGSYAYADMRIVPSFGGSMFEALMPALFVPEDRWGPKSWAINHPLTVRAQIYHGLVEVGYGYWGFSPCATPQGGYSAYGVAGIGMCDGYPSAGVVTPHASFLALRWLPEAALANLARLEHDFAMYDRRGFCDSVDVRTGCVAEVYLTLDQGIIMAAIGNALRRDMLRHAFATPAFRAILGPLIALERFNVEPPADQMR